MLWVSYKSGKKSLKNLQKVVSGGPENTKNEKKNFCFSKIFLNLPIWPNLIQKWHFYILNILVVGFLEAFV